MDKKEESNISIAIGVDFGYHLGKHGKETKIYYKVEPTCIALCSLYLCRDCENKLKEGTYVYMNVLPELKKLIKQNLVKQAILEGLK